eukprot:CAMPEP_0119052244 /NCGR_PEP_ID=MMETSP1177-20130426/73608_1 /TAXON_ID=2985 /ORGANISM="Ochromonas sp, Strain CCMP1899" /LENGTH=617 /DNA_ID=CAMNT_0007031749 /DNA_START=399 /DNA_END=2255 /DNA_ORIENTATION=+
MPIVYPPIPKESTYTPNYENAFSSALIKSKPSICAFGNETDSIKGKNLNKYITQSQIKDHENDLVYVLPEPYKTLLSLQNNDGVFTDLEAVLDCLFMPSNYSIKGYYGSEIATALAVSYMRQSNGLFEALQEGHDNACATFSNQKGYKEELLFEAREGLHLYQKKNMVEGQSEDLYLSQREIDEDLDRYLDSNDLKNHLPYGKDDFSNSYVYEKSDYSNYEFKKNDDYDTKIDTNNFETNRSEVKKDDFKYDIDVNGYSVDIDDQKTDRNEYGFNPNGSERNWNEHKADYDGDVYLDKIQPRGVKKSMINEADESDWRAKYDLYTNIRNTDNVTRDNYKCNDYNNEDSENDVRINSHIQNTDIQNTDIHNLDTQDKWQNLTEKSHVSNGKIVFQSRNYDKNDDDIIQSKNMDHKDDYDKDNKIIYDTYSHDNSHDPAIKRDGNDKISVNSELIACNISKSIEILRNTLIEHLLIMDRQLDMIKKCLVECSDIYRTCVSKYSQSLAFDELTARVGAGHMSMPGTGDWRNSDIPGYRYVCVQILCILSQIKNKSRKLNEMNRKKMFSSHIGGLVWRGQPVLTLLLTSLDFLHDNHELRRSGVERTACAHTVTDKFGFPS